MRSWDSFHLNLPNMQWTIISAFQIETFCCEYQISVWQNQEYF